MYEEPRIAKLFLEIKVMSVVGFLEGEGFVEQSLFSLYQPSPLC